MTFERMSEVARLHGWDEIRPQTSKAVNAYKVSDLKLALGY